MCRFIRRSDQEGVHSLVKILQKAGISFAILGVEEKCTGDFARRVGNEMMFQMMAQENIETLEPLQRQENHHGLPPLSQYPQA